MDAARVLLVEENPIMCKFVCSALAAEGIRVTEAHAGGQALGLWEAQPSDLVVQNLNLPDMDGFELVSRLRGLPGGTDVPILALSGLLSELEEARLSAVGFSDIIIKPIEVSRLCQVVRAHLPHAESSSASFGAGRRVLIVDDDPIQAKLVGVRLARLGFTTCSASDGFEALRQARLSAPDAIVSDVMMPVLDGFGLCAEIRQDPVLAGIPLVLMTNSYVDEADRQLARTAGADQFVIRTPSMQEVVEAVRSTLSRRIGERAAQSSSPLELKRFWRRRVLSQLDRQVTINTGMARRCSMLSAELAVLSGISDALARHDDIQVALTNVLGACVDAGGFSLGALHLLQGTPRQLLSLGEWDGWSEPEIRSLFERAQGSPEGSRGQPLALSTPSALEHLSPLLLRNNLADAVLVPITRGGVSFGTLLMGTRTNSLQLEDRLAFLEGVAAQIAQALTLARAFADKEASEQKACEQAAVLRSVLDTVAEGVVVADANGEFMLGNPGADAILGRDNARIAAREWPARLGLSLAESMTPIAVEQVPLLRALAGEIVDGREPLFLKEASSQRGKYVTISARPLEAGNRIAGAVAVLRDVTEEKSTQTRLLVADRLSSLGMLAAGVAHEINNPLAAVLANLELALQSLEAAAGDAPPTQELDECSSMLRDARDAANRVRRIARDLRVFAGSKEDEVGAVDIHAVLDSVLRMANNEVRHRAQVVRDFAQVPLVVGNESRLSQVFLNLVMNAAQALPDGRAQDNQIRVSTRIDPSGWVIVTIADTGEGISAESMRKLFVPFFTTKQVGLGTGLGLSICHRIVTAAGGEIKVESEPGKGAAFHVSLRPARPSQLPVVRDARLLDGRSISRRGRILVIDDDQAILDILTRALGRRHDCTSLSHGGEALARIAAGERFDVIFCDLQMPVMNGMDLFVELERTAPEQARKVVFLTGGAFTPRLQQFLTSVSNARFDKPFRLADLEAEVNARLQLPAS